ASLLWATQALAVPHDWGTDFQAAASPVMANIEEFHRLLLYIIVAISLFVLVLLLWVAVRYNQRANPTPSKTHHNTLLEVAWTFLPVLILGIIAVPSFRLLYFEAVIPQPDVTIKAIGKQWSWSYEYPGAKFTFDSLPLKDADAAKAGEPRLLGVDNAVVVPVNKVIEVETTGADVIHSWALPEMGVKMDAVPGRINHTWFKADRMGTFYGECSELCGANHDFMPIEVKVVSAADFAAWVASAKKKFASLDQGATTQLASR
ncbi:MAG: cytochrome c oxidase subunit II, partial [Alphaproteobacteria bacterium]|nr:cytochrome c oxidase subunit II [Alphaproteobacteria bacterium]